MGRRKQNLALPPEIESRLGEDTFGRQRAIFEADHLLLILHAPPAPEVLDREAIAFLRKPKGQWLCNGFEGGEQKLRKVISDYRLKYEECDRMFDAASSAAEIFALLKALAPLNRASTNLTNALQSGRDYVREDRFLIGVRDQAYEVSRAFELLAIDAKFKLDYRMAENSEDHARSSGEMARAQHKLNVLAAITFPLMALATLLGMNVVHGLEEHPPYVFAVILMIGIGIGMAVQRWVTRR